MASVREPSSGLANAGSEIVCGRGKSPVGVKWADEQPEDSLSQYMREALQQQDQLALRSKQQLDTQVLSMRELLDAQKLGVEQAQKQVEAITSKFPGQAENPELKKRLAKLARSQQQVLTLHSLLAASLGEMESVQDQVQQQAIEQTKSQVGGVLKMFKNQSVELRSTQQQVQRLQDFANQASVDINRAAAAQDARLQQTQAQVESLHEQLKCTRQSQEQLQSELGAEVARGRDRAQEVEQLQHRLDQSLEAQQRLEAEAKTGKGSQGGGSASSARPAPLSQAEAPAMPDRPASAPPGAEPYQAPTANERVTSMTQRIFELEAELHSILQGSPLGQDLLPAAGHSSEAGWESEEEWV